MAGVVVDRPGLGEHLDPRESPVASLTDMQIRDRCDPGDEMSGRAVQGRDGGPFRPVNHDGVSLRFGEATEFDGGEAVAGGYRDLPEPIPNRQVQPRGGYWFDLRAIGEAQFDRVERATDDQLGTVGG
jgi:hypothetical protein